MSRTEKVRLLLDATKTVVEREGIRGVTSRGIATEAGESLGTLTYYFPSLDALIEATIRDTKERLVTRARDWFAQRADADPVEAIVDWFTERTGEEVDVEKGYVLYLAAIAEPNLRHLATEWIEGYVSVLSEVLGDRTPATMIDGLLDASFVRRMLAKEPSPEYIAALRRSITGMLREFNAAAPERN